MPFDITRYPATWPTFTTYIKTIRAAGRCECTGQCRLHQPNPLVRRCSEIHGLPARHFKGKVILTTAHLCTCNPPCDVGGHVLAMCQRCHLRYDAHAKAARRRTRKRATQGNLYPTIDDIGATATNPRST